MTRHRGITLIEALTALVALVVVVAIAVPLWRTQGLRAQRAKAVTVMQAVQLAQDQHFARNARYAEAAALGVALQAPRYRIEMALSDDALGYVVTATALGDGTPDSVDSRCTTLRLDQHGRRSAANRAGEDSTAECWDRK